MDRRTELLNRVREDAEALAALTNGGTNIPLDEYINRTDLNALCDSLALEPDAWQPDQRQQRELRRFLLQQRPITAWISPAAHDGVQQSQPLVEVECGMHRVEGHAQPNHGERDLGVDANNDGDRSAEVRDVGEVAKSVGRIGIDDVQRSNVDEDAPDTVPTHLLDQVVLESLQLGVIQRGVDRSDQEAALPQDGHQMRLRRPGELTVPHRRTESL